MKITAHAHMNDLRFINLVYYLEASLVPHQLYLIKHATVTGFPRSGKSQGKIKKVQGQGKVREFCFWSGKFEILAKVREKSGNFRITSQTIFFSDDNYSSKSINSNDFQLLGELCYS